MEFDSCVDKRIFLFELKPKKTLIINKCIRNRQNNKFTLILVLIFKK